MLDRTRRKFARKNVRKFVLEILRETRCDKICQKECQKICQGERWFQASVGQEPEDRRNHHYTNSALGAATVLVSLANGSSRREINVASTTTRKISLLPMQAVSKLAR